MTKEFDYSPIDKILENHEKTAVIAILQDIQEIYHYLPKEIFPYLAKSLAQAKQEYTALRPFMRIFLSSQRANTLSNVVTALPVM